MVKKIFQDVVPPNKRSIRHIPLPGNRHLPSIEPEEKRPSTVRKRPRRQYSTNLLRWIVIAGSPILLIAVVFGASWFFASATVTVTPKQSTASLDAIVQATTKPDSEGLHYTTVAATSTASKIIPTDRETDVQRKASGQIVIYNNYTTEGQRLIKNTRFEAADGRIYRIDASVVVPGQTVAGGKKIPGSIAVTVYADVAGPEYNLPISNLKGDFSIPGFKGSSRYELFYARQKTDITGGFSGKARVVDDKTLESVENELKASLGEDIWKSLQASTPPEFALLRTLFSVDFSSSSGDSPKGDGVEVSVTAIARAVVFDARAFSNTVAKRTLADLDEKDSVLIENMDEINVVHSGQNTGDAIFSGSDMILNVKGNAHFVWQFDEQALKKALAGRKKGDTNPIMGNYPAIVKAEVVLKPLWLTKYPANTGRIHIVQKLDL